MTPLLTIVPSPGRAGLLSLALFVLAAGCEGSTHPARSDNGQTGSVGSAQCSVDADCRREADLVVAEQIADGYPAEVRSAKCSDGGLCDTVLRRGDDCFVHNTYGLAYDCALSDTQILQADAAHQEDLATCGGKGCPQAAAPVYHPRDPGEWDGMPVPLQGPYCEDSAHCGLALSCVDQMCGACTKDQDCAPGEGCVVEHCLKIELIGCRSYRDCGNSVCILSGITGGTPRGNEDMRSYCAGDGAGQSKNPAQ